MNSHASEPAAHITASVAQTGDGGEFLRILVAVKHNFGTVAAAALASLFLGAVYAFLAPSWYRADLVLFPVARQSAGSGFAQISGLASMAGVDIPGAAGSEPIAVLRSKSFARDFITSEDLMPILYARDWDSSRRTWKRKIIGNAPDLRDAAEYFDKEILGVIEDKKTGLVTISLRWKDPELAARWANVLTKRLNDRLRARAISQASMTMEYLQKEMIDASVISLQSAIGRVLDAELQKMAFARANEQFAFRVVDEAVAPLHRQSPRRIVLIALSLIFGAIIGVMIVLVRLRFGDRLKIAFDLLTT